MSSTEAQGGAAAFPRDPLAKSLPDLVTPKQLGMIRALAREAGVDPDEESQSVMRVRTEELSKQAASALIQHLKQLAVAGKPLQGRVLTPSESLSSDEKAQ
jgi:hypothetical protein